MKTIRDVTKLECHSCGTGFDLLENGGMIERGLNTENGTLYNLEVLCAECASSHSEYRARTRAAEFLLAGTGHSVGGPDCMSA